MSAYTQFKKLLDTLLSVLYSLNIIPKVLVRLKMTIYLQCQILSPSDPEVVVRPEKKKPKSNERCFTSPTVQTEHHKKHRLI